MSSNYGRGGVGGNQRACPAEGRRAVGARVLKPTFSVRRRVPEADPLAAAVGCCSVNACCSEHLRHAALCIAARIACGSGRLFAMRSVFPRSWTRRAVRLTPSNRSLGKAVVAACKHVISSPRCPSWHRAREGTSRSHECCSVGRVGAPARSSMAGLQAPTRRVKPECQALCRGRLQAWTALAARGATTGRPVYSKRRAVGEPTPAAARASRAQRRNPTPSDSPTGAQSAASSLPREPRPAWLLSSSPIAPQQMDPPRDGQLISRPLSKQSSDTLRFAGNFAPLAPWGVLRCLPCEHGERRGSSFASCLRQT